jgi:FkbM family methyltransferase
LNSLGVDRMSRLKLYAHAWLPERLVSWLEAARRRSYRGDPRTPAAHSRFMQLNESGRAGLITMREGIRFHAHPESFDSFQWFCWRSPAMAQEYDQFLSDGLGKSTFLDVGACHGVYSLTFLCLNPKGRVIAIEPSPTAREILEYNTAANNFDDRVEIISDAAGANNGTMHATANWHHLEATKNRQDAIAVGTRSIDAICDEYACTPDLVKVDVEGFELYVLQGATRLLLHRPSLYLEIHPQMACKLDYDHTLCFDLLAQFDYEITEVDGRPMTRRRFRERHHTFFTVCR